MFRCSGPSVTAVAIVVAGAAAPAHADVVAIDPFTGTHTDTFNQYTSVQAVQSLPVLGGLGTLENLTADGAIKVEWSSSLGGDLVTPISGMMAGQLGVGQWTFSTPVVRFGAWWENNSGADDATVEFYDADDARIGTMTAEVPVGAQQWTWNGWQSDVPIARLVVTGNGLISGFLWYENVQAEVVPAPAAWLLLLGSGAARRRRARTA